MAVCEIDAIKKYRNDKNKHKSRKPISHIKVGKTKIYKVVKLSINPNVLLPNHPIWGHLLSKRRFLHIKTYTILSLPYRMSSIPFNLNNNWLHSLTFVDGSLIMTRPYHLKRPSFNFSVNYDTPNEFLIVAFGIPSNKVLPQVYLILDTSIFISWSFLDNQHLDLYTIAALVSTL